MVQKLFAILAAVVVAEIAVGGGAEVDDGTVKGDCSDGELCAASRTVDGEDIRASAFVQKRSAVNQIEEDQDEDQEDDQETSQEEHQEEDREGDQEEEQEEDPEEDQEEDQETDQEREDQEQHLQEFENPEEEQDRQETKKEDSSTDESLPKVDNSTSMLLEDEAFDAAGAQYFEKFFIWAGRGKHRWSEDYPTVYRRDSHNAPWVAGCWSCYGVRGCLGTGRLFVWHDARTYENAEFAVIATGPDAFYIDEAYATSKVQGAPINTDLRTKHFGITGGSGWVVSTQANDGSYWGLKSRPCFKFKTRNGQIWYKTSKPCWGLDGSVSNPPHDRPTDRWKCSVNVDNYI